MTVAASDREVLLGEVRRFAERRVAPAVARHEVPLEASALTALVREAEELGLVATAGDEEPVALWSDASAEGAHLSVALLEALAFTSASLALALHQRALAAALSHGLRRPESPGRTTLLLHGRVGLGRGALARLLAHGAARTDDDLEVLADVFGSTGARLAWAPPEPADAGASYLLPVVSSDGALHWCTAHAAARSALGAPYGFDDLVALSVRPKDATPVAVGNAAPWLARALACDALGALGVALGAAEWSHRAARAFAHQRRQGGCLIEQHGAVQLLLASSRGAVDTARALTAAACEALGRDAGAGCAAALRAKAEAFPLLTRGVNDALQVFGGLGYMRDTGVEKRLRAVMHLRVTGGSPPELALFLDAWERCHDPL